MFSISTHISLKPMHQTFLSANFCGKIHRKNTLYGDISIHHPLVNVSHCSHCQCYSVIERNIAFSILQQYSLLLCSESWHCRFSLSTKRHFYYCPGSNWIKHFILKHPLYGLYVVPSALEGQRTGKKKAPPHITAPLLEIWSDAKHSLVLFFLGGGGLSQCVWHMKSWQRQLSKLKTLLIHSDLCKATQHNVRNRPQWINHLL